MLDCYSMPQRAPLRRRSCPGTHEGRSSSLNNRLSPVTFEQRLDDTLSALISEVESEALERSDDDLSLYGVLRYHLGQADSLFQPARLDSGKRIRPRVCVMTCEAFGGDEAHALPVAAAIEMIHNFTLIHDDIQDGSNLRRHRPSVWSLWGEAQAINAGDALFALAHLMLNSTRKQGVDSATVLDLSTELHRTTLRIVEGQVLDLGFESRRDVTASEYLTMIGGKTAAIIRYAAFAGAMVARAGSDVVPRIADFGQSLGVGFQIRDDLLGVWGKPEVTGKPEADDIRRRKKSLPILLLHDRLSDGDWEYVSELYRQPELTSQEVSTILNLLEQYEVQPLVQAEVQRWHDRAIEHLYAAIPDAFARVRLENLADSLVERIA